jgi:hypothetical protein
MTIRAFVLNTGYRLIGEVVDESAVSVDVKNPLVYTFAEAKEGMSVNFGPFAPEAAEKVITLNMASVTASFTPDSSISNHYKSVFGGIVTPPQTLQLLS